MAAINRRFERRTGMKPCATKIGDRKYWITDTQQKMKLVSETTFEMPIIEKK